MMRILHMSDLHMEMERWRLSLPGWQDFLRRHRDARRHPLRGPLLMDVRERIDLVLLAGDIHTGLRGIVYAEQLADYFNAPVVYVAGNHEYYHHYIDVLQPALHKAAAHSKGRVHFLDNDAASFTIAGQRVHVLGCTLWTDFALHGDPPAAMEFALRHMNDYRLIQRATAMLRPEHTLARHRRSRTWLRDNMARLRLEDPEAKIIILTHHAPHEAVLGRRKGDFGPSYATHILPDFAAAPPDLWVHGHTHHRHETMLEGIRVASAPRGYIGQDTGEVLDYQPGILAL